MFLKKMLLAAVFFICVIPVSHSAIMDDSDFYYSVTSSAEFAESSVMPVFEPVKYGQNKLVEDLKVSLVQAVPFGFLLSTLYITAAEAISQKTLSVKMKPVQEYMPVYYSVIGGLAAVTTVVNFVWYFDYQDSEKEVVDNGKTPQTDEKK
ncbi:MAG: hypothetical protein CVV21_12440 [Candidatus Goldiibacteriota bacterium HGW-Goldbacteria-1]|jgi:hypothetical protein|nr:MAG: hypothetical protein CVV21_12440 [Candidatus Goldiibacteriota bacterium HGW-Goldbacteria-1]